MTEQIKRTVTTLMEEGGFTVCSILVSQEAEGPQFVRAIFFSTDEPTLLAAAMELLVGKNPQLPS